MFNNSIQFLLLLLLLPSLSNANASSIEDLNSQLVSIGTGSTFLDGPGVRNQEVRYQNINGNAFIDGDIMLGSVEQAERKLHAIRQQEAGVNPMAIIIKAKRYRWPQNTIAYQINAWVDVTTNNQIQSAIKHWSTNTAIKFILRTANNAALYPNFVNFMSNEQACWSYVGMIGKQQDVNLISACGVDGAIHEIGHVVGIWHEQSRSDRLKYVTINWNNIKAGKENNFRIHNNDGIDAKSGYDYASIMHYGRTAFAKSDPATGIRLETITPTQANITIGTTTVLSAGDIAGVLEFYPAMP